MEGLTASEITLIRRLAGNDALIRKKNIKKMRIWLTAILRRVPDSPDCRELIENNFIRVWKALFYCMWMADKPLPQEQLAEQISSLVDIFTSKPHVMNLFIEWFFRTMAREWQWIDRFRMDKFMMLVRRFFRKSLEAVSKHQWKLDTLDGFLNVITVIIFNHHPEVKKTRSKARDPAPEVTPLGLQIHIVDIFLEEVAKVGGNKLKSKKILKILKPFIHELSTNDDERILNEIRERIFFHLMKQSDVGIDYAEGGVIDEELLSDEEEEEESNKVDETPSKGKKNKGKGKQPEEDEDSEGDMEDEKELVGPLDPRAGAVDVILPQLEIDYKELAERLIKIGGQKTVRMKNRKMMYNLARQFQKLTTGDYPLAIDLEPPKPAIRHKDIEEAAKRLVKLEESMENPDRKRRQPKKIRKKLAKQKLQGCEIQEITFDNSLGSTDGEGNTSIYLEDSELLDHVSDNYMSYLEELHQQNDLAGTNGNDDEEDDEEEENEEEETSSNREEEEEVNVNLSGDKDEEVDEEDNENIQKVENCSKIIKGNKIDTIKLGESPALQAKVKASNIKSKIKKQMNNSLANGSQESNQENSTIESPKIPTKKKRLSTSPNFSDASTIDGDEDDDEQDYVSINGNKFLNTCSPGPSKRRKNNDGSFIFTPTSSPATASSSTKRKRVSFVLARNLQHEHSDYKNSIERSPAIPFDSLKKPNFGLLKSPKSPAATSLSFSNTPFRSRYGTARRASGRF